jgi:hypothetical protein
MRFSCLTKCSIEYCSELTTTTATTAVIGMTTTVIIVVAIATDIAIVTGISVDMAIMIVTMIVADDIVIKVGHWRVDDEDDKSTDIRGYVVVRSGIAG